jgi:hypothetical protein
MTITSIIRRRFLAPVAFLGFAGCGGSPGEPVDAMPRTAVSGTVTLDGAPLAAGTIQFSPVPGEKATTTTAVGTITDGKYVIERPLGPAPGNYKVSISSRPPVTIGPGQEPGPPPKMEPEKVPAKFNSQTTLTKEITDGGPNFCDFDLKGS